MTGGKKEIIIECPHYKRKYRLSELNGQHCPFCGEGVNEQTIRLVTLIEQERQAQRIRIFCAILGVTFAGSGLVLSATLNLSAGIALTLFAIIFIVLALKYEYIKVKIWKIIIEIKK